MIDLMLVVVFDYRTVIVDCLQVTYDAWKRENVAIPRTETRNVSETLGNALETRTQ
jgi:hypothetical protein